MKQCKKCHRILDASDFHNDSHTSDGLRSICKKCATERAKASRERTQMASGGLLDVYYDIIKRCYNTASVSYSRYGGRGIRMCAEWLNDRQAFFDWCKANGHRPGLQIDRIDNDGDYSPENCRFVTRSENQHNTSQTKLTEEIVNQIRANNISRKYTQQQLAKQLGISQALISQIVKNKAWKKPPKNG